MPDSESPARFRTKPVEIEAIQYTGSNADAIAAFAGEGYTYGTLTGALILHAPAAELYVDVGDWVVRVGHRISIFTPAAFAIAYEAAPEPLELSEVERAALMTDFHFSTCNDRERCPDCAHKVKEYRAVLAAVSEPIAEQAREEHLLELGAAGRLHLPCSTMSPEFGIVWLDGGGNAVDRWACYSLDRVRELLAAPPAGAAGRLVETREIWSSPWTAVPEEALQAADEPEGRDGDSDA